MSSTESLIFPANFFEEQDLNLASLLSDKLKLAEVGLKSQKQKLAQKMKIPLRALDELTEIQKMQAKRDRLIQLASLLVEESEIARIFDIPLKKT